ncbi:MAG: hypothetical protein N2749_05665 [Clostridia bacterium]|nr:hypothetical protein [Clostridia bacterium]
MRYYIYLDKSFLKSLFSAISDIDFDIGIVEFSTQKSYSTTQDYSIEPKFEKVNENEFKDTDIEGTIKNTDVKTKGEANINKGIEKNKNLKSVGLSIDRSDTYQTSSSRKFINIEDISDIKNDNFYHKLVEGLYGDLKKYSNICFECGCISPCKLRNRYEFESEDASSNWDTKNKFFKINDTYVWIDPEKLGTDLIFLSNIVDNVNVIGYNINEDKDRGYRIIKAVAIYIE